MVLVPIFENVTDTYIYLIRLIKALGLILVSQSNYLSHGYFSNNILSTSSDEYQFTSSDPEVIKIEGYSAACLKEGYSDIAIQGPGINQDTSLSFYVGSIAGKYVPENKGLSNLVSFEIGEINNNEQRISNFTLTIKEGTFKKTQLKPYTGSGSFLKGSPFLALEFEEDDPKYYKPVTDYL